MDINGNQVIAVDFDGTLCKQAWPEIGEENEILIEHLKEQQAAGARLILWTNREGDLLEEAVEWCKARRPDIRHSKREPSGTDRPIQERLQEDKRRHLHRRQGSKPGSVQTRGRNVRF